MFPDSGKRRAEPTMYHVRFSLSSRISTVWVLEFMFPENEEKRSKLLPKSNKSHCSQYKVNLIYHTFQFPALPLIPRIMVVVVLVGWLKLVSDSNWKKKWSEEEIISLMSGGLHKSHYQIIPLLMVEKMHLCNRNE